MQTIILDGKALAEKKRSLLGQDLTGRRLDIIQIGDNAASKQYVAIKKRVGEQLGVSVTIHAFDQLSFNEFSDLVASLTANTNGIMLQLPLPDSLRTQTQQFLDAIPTELDIDGLNSTNLAAIRTGKSRFLPAVVNAVTAIIEEYKLVMTDTRIVVIGNGQYVGAPIAARLQSLFPHNHLSVLDINTMNFDTLAAADLVISCVGAPHAYTAKRLKRGATLIDVGTSRHPTLNKIVGDFDVSEAADYISAYTPVPGGVGPMTVISLLENLL
jgi:methylenetetrahydrofolate dehydrogenase (NADP+)/methenyltetrahydrofolate cyclohydrolase